MDKTNCLSLKENSYYAQNGVNGLSVGTSGLLSLCPSCWCLFVFIVAVVCFCFLLLLLSFIFAVKNYINEYDKNINELKHSLVENV